MRRVSVLAIGCAALMLAACGGDDSSSDDELREAVDEALDDAEEGDIPGAPGAEDACKVVKRDDVEAVFGGDVSRGTEDFAGCNFEVTEGAVGVDGSVSVRLEITGPLEPEELFEQTRGTYDPAMVGNVAGVGDGAYYVEGVGALTALEDDTVFTVQAVFLEIGTDTTIDQGDLRTRVIDLAEIVAGRV